jgi:hypothetical protein
MVVPPIDRHIGAPGHVARRTGKRRVCHLVTVVCDRGVFIGGVTLQADAVSGCAKFRVMRPSAFGRTGVVACPTPLALLPIFSAKPGEAGIVYLRKSAPKRMQQRNG